MSKISSCSICGILTQFVILVDSNGMDIFLRSASASGLIRLAVRADVESFPWMLFVLRIIGVRVLASVIGGDDACTTFVPSHFGEESSTDGDEY